MGEPSEIAVLRDKVEELQEILKACHEVNAHMAIQVEQLATENDSLKQHLRRLKKRLKPHSDPLNSNIPQITSTPSIGDQVHEDSIENDTKEWSELQSFGQSRGWIIDPNHIEVLSVIGEGSFGATYRAVLHGADVCVKMVKLQDGNAEAFAREFTVLTSIHHPNVLSIYGAVIDPPERCWLVTEFLQQGTLAQWLHGTLHSRRPPQRSLLNRLKMALDVACGMESLEQHDPPIVHRDLKPSNVLLDGAGRAKVADMGLARMLTPNALINLTPETGSYLYMAPEVIRHELYATQADVWSWACLVCELLTQSKPYSERHLTPVQVALHVADGELRPAIPTELPTVLVELLQAALHSDPPARPSFAVIASVMRQVVQQEEQKQKLRSDGSSHIHGGVMHSVTSAWMRWGASHKHPPTGA